MPRQPNSDLDENQPQDERHPPQPPVSPRAPLRELSEPPERPAQDRDELDQHTRRRVPNSHTQASSSTLVQPVSSGHFASLPISSASTLTLANERFLSPVGPLTIEEFLGEEDEDFGDMDIDDAFLAEVQQAEMAAMGPSSTSSSNSNRNTSSLASGAPDVITIDEDEDEKENVPVPQRHVRRRIEPGEVIEIFSDSE
jgi:RecQ-mediated genome instability protein 1